MSARLDVPSLIDLADAIGVRLELSHDGGEVLVRGPELVRARLRPLLRENREEIRSWLREVEHVVARAEHIVREAHRGVR